jgi:hypothetical protein
MAYRVARVAPPPLPLRAAARSPPWTAKPAVRRGQQAKALRRCLAERRSAAPRSPRTLLRGKSPRPGAQKDLRNAPGAPTGGRAPAAATLACRDTAPRAAAAPPPCPASSAQGRTRPRRRRPPATPLQLEPEQQPKTVHLGLAHHKPPPQGPLWCPDAAPSLHPRLGDKKTLKR